MILATSCAVIKLAHRMSTGLEAAEHKYEWAYDVAHQVSLVESVESVESVLHATSIVRRSNPARRSKFEYFGSEKRDRSNSEGAGSPLYVEAPVKRAVGAAPSVCPVTLSPGPATQAHSAYCASYSNAVTRIISHSAREFYFFSHLVCTAHLHIWLTSSWGLLHPAPGVYPLANLLSCRSLIALHYPGRHDCSFLSLLPRSGRMWGGHKSPIARDIKARRV